MSATKYLVGVDVGTSSVRAGLFSEEGSVLATATNSIKIFEPQPDFYEQSSDDIWNSCCSCVKSVTQDINKADVLGIGFDATCSMVVLDKSGNPLSSSPTGDNCWNIIMWMDHRAKEQSARINKSNHKVLRYVGGSIYLEMQTPKLLWLKENLKSTCFDRAGHFMDLPDFLTYKATGNTSRSLCSLVCKWTYLADKNSSEWSDSFFREIGLGELADEGYSRMGIQVLTPGDEISGGLSTEAAEDLGLLSGTAVATSIVDAHAGGLGTLGCHPNNEDLDEVPLQSRMALICGTSTCHMTVTQEPVFVPGVWGPYYSALVPGLWLLEGGQSATGKLVDFVVENHSAYSWVKSEADKKQVLVFNILNDILRFIAKKNEVTDPTALTKDVHVWPDYHGNRSPISDVTLRGMICGLTLSAGAEELAIQYLATIQALAYGTRHILEVMEESSHKVKMLVACGGLSKNQQFIQAHADVTGLPVLIPSVSDPVLLGAAMLGACAASPSRSLSEIIDQMSGRGEVVVPCADIKKFHDKKYKVFKNMYKFQKEASEIMR